MAPSQSPVRTSAYQCAICKEQYSRPDHLIRHVRTHTKQRPFVCTICTKAFARQDLLKRHSLAHGTSSHSADSLQDPDALADGGRYGPRVRQACRACAMKKLKCNDEKPCQRCTQKNIPCHYEQSPDPPHRLESAEPADDPTNHNSLATASTDSCEMPETPMAVTTWLHAQKSVEQPGHGPVIVQSAQPGDERAEPASLDVTMGEFDLAMAQGDSLTSSHVMAHHDILGCTLDLPSFGDFIQQDFDPDIGALDLPLVPDMSLMPAAVPVSSNPCNNPSQQSPVMGMGTDAYQGSHVRRGWDPRNEGCHSETENLELPSNTESEDLSALHNRRIVQLKNDDVDVGTRDKFLMMIYSRTSKSIWGRMSATFESLDVLKGIAHHALFHMQEKQVIPFIHVPSLDLNEQRPEVLGALWAYGAVSLPSGTMRQFGYGLQELVRLAISQTVKLSLLI